MTGDAALIIDGQPVARHGDKTSGGATLISSQVTTFTDPGSAQGASTGGATVVQAMATASMAAAAAAAVIPQPRLLVAFRLPAR
ncbi:PAAR domain-containing protein [Luteimonas sp. R10]|uniref:PAAR domain-containing protein n=1 Tax=Luteimonas sp. R10 TaxID=3108176 RepID=UPI0030848A17|nr:PAAR domain-containing protein [Luteimonas sp. R10]